MLQINARRFLQNLTQQAQFGRLPADQGGGIDRRSFSVEDRAVRAFFSQQAQTTNKIAFHILQEYARSAVFDRIFLVDLSNIEHLIEHLPLTQQSQAAYQMIASTIHMINVYNHIDSVTDTFSDPAETARIATLGYGQFDKEISYFFYTCVGLCS